MCGIAGAFMRNHRELDTERLRKASSSLMHRGPDDEGFFINGSVGLAHRRLSIIDLNTGHQPLSNEDGSIWIVYNGEIYNFEDLRADLLKKGHRFKTKTDTEVIIHLYEEKGIDCLKHLRGMFAFAIYDKSSGTIFFARDRLGVKPFLYTSNGSGFFFASEIQGLLNLCDTERRIDPEAVDLFFSLQYIPAPHTAFSGIRKLPPAHYGIVKDGELVKTERYWNVNFADKRKIAYEEAKEELRRLFFEAVKIRMISDVPLGAFLSGGVDSSITVAAMSALSDRPVKTFSIGFEERKYSELEFAGKIAKRFGTDHHEEIIKMDAVEALPGILQLCGEPFADQSVIPTYYVSKYTRQNVTVALSGDGGDENFAGYKRYYQANLVSFLESHYLLKGWRAARKATVFLERLFNKSRKGIRFPVGASDEILNINGGLDRYIKLIEFYNKENKDAFYRGGMREIAGINTVRNYLNGFYEHSIPSEIERLLCLDLNTYLPEDILFKVDIASMANSLECRSPYLDHELIEFAAALPAGFKFKFPKTGKYILKDTFSDLIPLSFFEREKKGFSMPLREWFRGELHTVLKDIIAESGKDLWESFNKDYVTGIMTEHNEGRADHSKKLWCFLVFAYWKKLFNAVL